MITLYPLEWLDNLILQTLNPKKNSLKDLSDKELSLISEQLQEESQRVQLQLTQEVFSFQSKTQVRLLIRNYHSTLVFLLDTLLENQKEPSLQTARLTRTVDTMVGTINELLFFLEKRFSPYLSLDQRVPVAYLLVARKELILKLEKLEKKKWAGERQKETLQLVIDVVFNFIHACSECKITYRQILYQKELIANLELLDITQKANDRYTELDELLVRLNFNSVLYMDYLLEQISISLAIQPSLQLRMGELLLYYKEFGQLSSNEKISFDPLQQNIKLTLENWFTHEIYYLEKTLALAQGGQNDSKTQLPPKAVAEQNKVECNLSIDQMGLILRAADEARILKARSLNHVFKTIVPYLSSAHKKDLSYNSMRSKSYTAEEKDKEIAIQALERIIRHIREF